MVAARGRERKPSEDHLRGSDDQYEGRTDEGAHSEPTRTTLGGVWTRVAARLRAELGEDLYTSWFARMEPESLADGTLNVSVPTRFLRSWIKSHYVDQLTACCAAEYKGVTAVELQVRTRGPAHRSPGRGAGGGS